MLERKIGTQTSSYYNLHRKARFQSTNIQLQWRLAFTMESRKTSQGVKQIFFDCDNTLVSTEEVASEAAATVVNKVLADRNVSRRFENMELFTLYFGKTAREMIVELQKEYHFSLSEEQLAAYTSYEEDLVIELIHANPIPCGGVKEILQQLYESKNYKLAVVSSSPIRRIRAALEAANIARYFDHDQVFSAKSSMPSPKSKPDPAIYRWAMKKNNVEAHECIAFEDSRSGARSAIDAGITCVAYVGAYSSGEMQRQVAKTLEDEGCTMVMTHYNELRDCLEKLEQDCEDKREQQRVAQSQL